MTTPKPSHGWLFAPLVPGWYWCYLPDMGKVLISPVDVYEPEHFRDPYYPPGTLWHPCLPPEPPVQ